MKRIKNVILVAGLGAGIAIICAPIPAGLSAQGADCLGVAVLCFCLWLIRPIPLAATSLLAIALLPILNIEESSRVFSFFGNSAVFFLLGVFILTGAIIHTGLSKRLAYIFINRFGSSARGMLFGVFLTCTVFALFMPEHAVAAMMLPIVLEISAALNLQKGRSNFGKALFILLGYGAIVGGIGTYLGGARVPLAVELLHETFNTRIDFMQWASAAVPVVILLLLPVYIIVNIKFKPEIENISSAKAFLQEEFHRMGKISRDELITAFISVVTILFWIAAGHQINVAVISIGAAVFVFVFRIAHWIDLNDYINWGVIIMYGGAIALGRALAETGAIEWLASEAIGASTLSPIMFVIVLSLLSLILTEFISNVAAVVILLPMAYGFIAQTGLSAETVTLIITIPAGLAFCMPISTPPNAIAFSAGYFSMKDLFSIGIVLKLVAWLIFLGVALLYWPFIGFQF